jgi:hypothetical protein
MVLRGGHTTIAIRHSTIALLKEYQHAYGLRTPSDAVDSLLASVRCRDNE